MHRRTAAPPNHFRDGAVRRVLAGAGSELHSQITDDVLRTLAMNEEHVASVRTAGVRSMIVVPIAGRAGLIGAMTFMTAESGRSYTPRDLAFAEDLAKRAGLALENARLYNRNGRRAAQLNAPRTV